MDMKVMVYDHSYDLAAIKVAWKAIEVVTWSTVLPVAAAKGLPHEFVRVKSLSFLRLGKSASPYMRVSIVPLLPLSLLFLVDVYLHFGTHLDRKLQLLLMSVIQSAHQVYF